MTTLLRELRPLLNLDALTGTGRALGKEIGNRDHPTQAATPLASTFHRQAANAAIEGLECLRRLVAQIGRNAIRTSGRESTSQVRGSRLIAPAYYEWLRYPGMFDF